METELKIENEEKKHDEEVKLLFRHLAEDTMEAFRFWLDWTEESYYIITTWAMGILFHEQFTVFPLLFINATKGAGKTRALKLLAYLFGGTLIGSPTESTLFRYPMHKLMCLDECESIGSKEKLALREILNSSYKRGLFVPRQRKVKTPEGEKMETELFEPFKPIAIANIWGMEEVLGDRSVKLIVDKSNSKAHTKLIENFENDEILTDLKKRLAEFKVRFNIVNSEPQASQANTNLNASQSIMWAALLQ